MTSLLQRILRLLAKGYLWKYHPKIVAVTGNVGKTSTKEAIAAVLKGQHHVRMSGGNLNNELGVPLTILGDWTDRYYAQGGTAGFWLHVLPAACWGLVFSRRYPEILVLEYGADHPGDIKHLARTYKPHIGVVTAVGDTPVHVEFFASPKHLADEKAQLVKALGPMDAAVLNFDDLTVLEMKEKTHAHVLTFGMGEGALVRAVNYEYLLDQDEKPRGISFRMHYGGGYVPIVIKDSLGQSQAMAAAAATAVGIHLGMNLVQISAAFTEYSGPAGRLKILRGIKDTVILDDTYNASPSSMHLAMETLKALPLRQAQGKPGRKIAVLGDMLELGKYSIDAHRTVGDLAGEWLAELVCVGEKSRLIADSAQNEMPASPDASRGGPALSAGKPEQKIYWFHTSDEAKIKVQEILQPGDIVLVKGSQGKRMEKIVEEIMAEPQRKSELLVRQSKRWLEK